MMKHRGRFLAPVPDAVLGLSVREVYAANRTLKGI